MARGKHLCLWLIHSFALMEVDLSRLLPSLGGCGVTASGLGRLFMSSDNSDFLFDEAVCYPIASFPDRSTELMQLRALATLPLGVTQPPSLRKRHPSSFCSFKNNFCFYLGPRNPRVPTFPFVWVCPYSLPLTPANLVHVVLDSLSLAWKPFPELKPQIPRERRARVWWSANFPPPPPSCLLCSRGSGKDSLGAFSGVDA